MSEGMEWVLLVLSGMISGGCIGYWIGLIVGEIRDSKKVKA